MPPPIPTYLLDALAPQMKAGRKTLPCEVLRKLLLQQSVHSYSKASIDAALLLAATYRKVLLGAKQWLPEGEIGLPARAKWQRACINNTQLLYPAAFCFAPPHKALAGRPSFELYAFLQAIPEAFVAQLVEWAPPIVAIDPVSIKSPTQGITANRHGASSVPVLGNVLSAFLAKEVLPKTLVRTRVLKKYTKARFGLHDFVQLALPAIDAIALENCKQIVCTAPVANALSLGVLLTDWSLSNVKQIRSRSSHESLVSKATRSSTASSRSK